MMPRAILAYSDYQYRGVPSTPLLLLARSLRAFGGRLADLPIWCYLGPEGRVEGEAPAGLASEAAALGVSLRTADPPLGEASSSPSLSWPFGAKAIAAARAEAEAREEAPGATLLWLDRDSLVLGDPSILLLGEAEDLAYRPVNKAGIGVGAGEAPDAWWMAARRVLGLGQESQGRVVSYLEGRPLEFYLAAGLLAVRPGAGILGAWAEALDLLARDPEVAESWAASPRHRVFLHQAALALAAGRVPESRRRLLPPSVMYPLNLYGEDGPHQRPASLAGVVSLRYDETLEDAAQRPWDAPPFTPAQSAWLGTFLGA